MDEPMDDLVDELVDEQVDEPVDELVDEQVDEPVDEQAQHVKANPQKSTTDCLKQRVKFEKNGLPILPVFEPGTCLFTPKQCNEEE